jgi:hypothetical protein
MAASLTETTFFAFFFGSLVEFVLFSGETYAHFAKAAADLLGPHTDL